MLLLHAHDSLANLENGEFFVNFFLYFYHNENYFS